MKNYLWSAVLALEAGPSPGFGRFQGQNLSNWKCTRGPPTYCKGFTSSSISFDHSIGHTQEKDQLQELLNSFNLTMGTAFGAFTEILSIIFPKAIYKGDV